MNIFFFLRDITKQKGQLSQSDENADTSEQYKPMNCINHNIFLQGPQQMSK